MSTLDSSVVPPSVVHVVAAPKEAGSGRVSGFLRVMHCVLSQDASDISTADTSGSEAEEREERVAFFWPKKGVLFEVIKFD